MRAPALPGNVIRFIRDFIDRLETLEVLALLIADRSRGWTTDRLTWQMRSSGTATKMALDSLVRVGLVVQEGQAFVFRAASVELEDAARGALDCYRDRRTSVIAAIYQNRRRRDD